MYISFVHINTVDFQLKKLWTTSFSNSSSLLFLKDLLGKLHLSRVFWKSFWWLVCTEATPVRNRNQLPDMLIPQFNGLLLWKWLETRSGPYVFDMLRVHEMTLYRVWSSRSLLWMSSLLSSSDTHSRTSSPLLSTSSTCAFSSASYNTNTSVL